MVALIFVAMATLCGVAAWPRVTPEKLYYANGSGLWYCKTPECSYGEVVTFRSMAEAEESKLKKCPVCFPEDYRVANK